MKKSLLVGLLILTSVCFIFGQAKTLDANNGMYIYLNGSKTTLTEDEYLSYAKSIGYSVYNKYKNDEFEWYDQFQTLKQKLDDSVANADLTSTYTIVTSVNFGDYDFSQGGFPVAIGEGTFFPLGTVDKGWNADYKSIFTKTIALKLDAFDSYNFLEMEKDAAKTFLQSRKNSYGNVNREITLEITYKIASYDSAEYKSFANLALANDYIPVVGIIEKIVVYDTTGRNEKQLGNLIKK